MGQQIQIRREFTLQIVVWGTIWGIFEATVGYLLHLLPLSIGWLVWYPMACFFLSCVYRNTNKIYSVLFVGILCAAIKMLNLFLPGRIDRVINPAFSIVFEALSLYAVIWVLNRHLAEKRRRPLVKALAALGMNTGWRALYVLYLFFLVPDWIREVSVISSMESFLKFFVKQNILTSLVVFLGWQFQSVLFRPVEAAQHKIDAISPRLPVCETRAFKISLAAVLICANVALNFVL